MRKQEELVKSMDAAIEDSYLKAPEIVALCAVSQPCRNQVAKTALGGGPRG